MKHILTLALILATPQVYAGNWWMIHAQGVKPGRQMVYANADSVKPSLTSDDILAGNYSGKTSVEVTTVFELAEAPDRIQIRYLVDCEKNSISTDFDWVTWRDGRTEQRKTKPWTPIEIGSLEDRIRLFSCDEGARNDANLMLFVGGVGFAPVDLTWNLFWKDGARPAYTTTKSREEIDAIYTDALADVKQAIDRDRAISIKQIAWREEASRRLARRKPSEINGRLERFVGMDEKHLIRIIGIPSGSYHTDEARFLAYRGEFQQTYDGINYISSDCDITFELYEGNIIDFKANGSYCNAMLSKLSR